MCFLIPLFSLQMTDSHENVISLDGNGEVSVKSLLLTVKRLAGCRDSTGEVCGPKIMDIVDQRSWTFVRIWSKHHPHAHNSAFKFSLRTGCEFNQAGKGEYFNIRWIHTHTCAHTHTHTPIPFFMRDNRATKLLYFPPLGLRQTMFNNNQEKWFTLPV